MEPLCEKPLTPEDRRVWQQSIGMLAGLEIRNGIREKELVAAVGTALRASAAGRNKTHQTTTYVQPKSLYMYIVTSEQQSYHMNIRATDMQIFSEKDPKLAQNLGQLQPFTAVNTPTRNRGPACIFWADI